MFKDLHSFDTNQVLKYDVCIVGTGPAGISVAKKLLGSKKKVVILESGGIEPSVEYNELNKGENSGPRFLSLDASRSRCFGGASRIWAGVCSPFSVEDFNEKSYIPLSGWPIVKDDLVVYYKEAAEMLGISYDLFNTSNPFTNTLNGLSFPEFNRNNSLLLASIYQKSDSYNRNFGDKYRKLFSNSENVDVLFHSTVTRLNTSQDGKHISNIEAEDLSNKKCTINAKNYVLAAGALENPRILLNSDHYYKNGIGNESGFVGSCFMSHPGITEVGEIMKTSEGFCINKNKFSKNLISQFELSPSTQLSSEVLGNAIGMNTYTDLANLSTYYSGRLLTEYKKLIKNFDFKQSVEKTACRLKGKYASNLWNLNIGLEQEPDHRNHLTLNPSMKDFFGVPLIDMFWAEISEREKMTVIESVKVLAREFGITNSGRVKFTDKLLSGEAFEREDSVNHHIGTTRMAKTSATGVVDKNCKVFNISNLYLAGSSLFPTSSIVNPTYTIIALSLRLGERLKRVLA
jgi:choline dehydrogenase-like flavoprotein